MESLFKKFEDRRKELLARADAREAELPLRYLAQQAHYTTPAGNYDIILKAVERGTAPAARILEKLHISAPELAGTLGLDTSVLKDALSRPRHAPLVLIDGEDAQALRDDVIERGRDNAVRAFREAKWGRALRFYRPSGLELEYCTRDLFHVLLRAGENLPPEHYPIDGVIFPKLRHVDELQWLCDLLAAVETEMGLPEHRIKLQFLVESAWAVLNLPELVQLALPRLTGIILGNADYSAEVGLPVIATDHPVIDWVRHEMVNVAGAVGIPAIDNMTINYPVADPTLEARANKRRVLARLKECFDDARHGLQLGMSGKWVGHPLQLFVTLLAYDTAFSEQRLAEELHRLDVYRRSIEQEQGTMVIRGVMTDRAMDRHSRALLRKAVALGRLAPDKGLQIGVISQQEFDALRQK